jgi:hypothetical protein
MPTAEPGRQGPSELHVQNMGVYRWGSLLPEFGALSEARAQDFPRNLTSMIAGVGNWDTPVEFRAWAALSHELVHYLQDLTTGIGHWDHKVREAARPRQLGAAKFFSESELAEMLELPTHVGREDLGDELVMLTGEALPGERLDALRRNAGASLRNPEAAADFRIECVLEAEAAAVVLAQVIRLKKATKAQWEILDNNMGVWHPDHMERQYGVLFDNVQALLTDEQEVDLDGDELDNLFLMIAHFVGVLADISCAHPPPEMLRERGEERSVYEPGLRFLRLLLAIHDLPEKRRPLLSDAIWNRDSERAERLLAESSPYSYPSSSAVYEAWLPRFEGSDNRIDALRADTCRIRLEHPSAWADKWLFSILEHKLPFTVAGPDGFTSVGQRWEDLEPRLAAELYIDITRNAMDDALISLFFETGRFVCPFGVGQVCDSAAQACREGLRRTADFPASPGCKARKTYENEGFELGVAS